MPDDLNPAWLVAVEPYIGDDVERESRIATLLMVITTCAAILSKLEAKKGSAANFLETVAQKLRDDPP